ncbi:acetolactate decarboxylase [Winogradskyella sp. MIT101101]|uniref:acetolactate decarboxylase n=1 Tax=Winogradskyella sp. MIT101101 TaxID=3098297 RepID=UPI00399A891C
MTDNKTVLLLMLILLQSCNFAVTEPNTSKTYSNVRNIAAMKDVMWQGELYGKINIDTIKNRKGLYGLGPKAFLDGEILINNGKTYLSKVKTDSTMAVEQINSVEAPFFVYANVNEWEQIQLPDSVKSIKSLEKYLDSKTKDKKRPFAFKLVGKIENGIIHIQNLPKGVKVSSPKEAHQGQVNYSLENEEVEIVGFFSTEHQGIFTHHDSFLHMHLITKSLDKMGHLDKVSFSKMTLFLPKS